MLKTLPGLRSHLILAVAGAGIFAGAVGFLLLRAESSETSGGDLAATGLTDERELELGQPAPNFTLESARDEGRTIQLSDLRGKAVVLNFYASWCGPCRQELPEFEAVSQEFAADVVFLAVNVQESRGNALGILESTGASFSAVLDSDGSVANRYGLRGMPSTYLLDANGIVRKFGPGAVDGETLRAELMAIVR